MDSSNAFVAYVWLKRRPQRPLLLLPPAAAACCQHLLWALQMQKIPDLEKLDLKDITSYGGAMEHGEERAKKHDKAASLYNHVCPEPFVSRLAVCMLLSSSLLAGLTPIALAGSCSPVT